MSISYDTYLSLEMGKLWTGVEDWINQSGVCRVAYHGGALNGNGSRRLLENIDLLQTLAPLHILPYVKTLRLFRKVVLSCFSLDLKMSYKDDIDAFKASFLDLGIAVTPKVHCIFFHVYELCSKNQRGLGLFSEQASESVHHKFEKTWTKYKVSKGNKDFDHQLLRAVAEFNTSHL